MHAAVKKAQSAQLCVVQLSPSAGGGVCPGARQAGTYRPDLPRSRPVPARLDQGPPNIPLVWRLSKEVAGSGSHGDLVRSRPSTCCVTSPAKSFKEVCGIFETFIKQPSRRPAHARRPDHQRQGNRQETQAEDGQGGRGRRGVVPLSSAGGAGSGRLRRRVLPPGITIPIRLRSMARRGRFRFDFPNFSFLEFFGRHPCRGRRRAGGGSRVRPGRIRTRAGIGRADHPIGYAETFINTAADIVENLAGKSPGVPCEFSMTACVARKCWKPLRFRLKRNAGLRSRNLLKLGGGCRNVLGVNLRLR